MDIDLPANNLPEIDLAGGLEQFQGLEWRGVNPLLQR